MAKESAGFESYLKGAWWDVQIKGHRSSMFLVCYNTPHQEEWAWLPITEVRLRSRIAIDWDCYDLQKGADVAVIAEHPHTKDLSLHKEGLYDAKISSVKSSKHKLGKCSCKFLVLFYSVRLETYPGGLVRERTLLTGTPPMEVSISKLRILQRLPERIPFRDFLEMHMEEKSIPMGRACRDAIFLAETDLRSSRNPRRIFDQGDTPPPADVRTRVRSCEDMSGSGPKLSTKNGDKDSNCDSLVGSEREPPGSRPAPDRFKPHHPMPDSTPVGEVHYVDEKLKGRNGCVGDKPTPLGPADKRREVTRDDFVHIASSSDSDGIDVGVDLVKGMGTHRFRKSMENDAIDIDVDLVTGTPRFRKSLDSDAIDMDAHLEKVREPRRYRKTLFGRPEIIEKRTTDREGDASKKKGDSGKGVKKISTHHKQDKPKGTNNADGQLKEKKRGRPRKDKSNVPPPQVSIRPKKDEVKTQVEFEEPSWSDDSEKSDSEGEWKPKTAPTRHSIRVKHSKP